MRIGQFQAKAALLLCLGVALVGCNNECDYFEKCDGSTRLVCGEGPDQAFNRKEHAFPCTAPNEACVEIDENHAACVLPSLTKCTDTSVRCEGNMLVSCTNKIHYTNAPEPPQWEQGTDCSVEGGTCMASGMTFECVIGQ